VPCGSPLHDWGVNERYGVFPVMAVATDPDRLRAKGRRRAWDPSKPAYLGVVPRHGDVVEARGFSGPTAIPFERAELLVFDTARFGSGPVTRVLAPVFLRPTFHGNWVPFPVGLPGAHGNGRRRGCGRPAQSRRPGGRAARRSGHE
jgi:carotenoid cleavage dioxygenase-like enzyme